MKRDAEKFFYDHAGYSHGPAETAEQGRRRCAKELAQAEYEAWHANLEFSWEVDPDTNSSDFDSSPDPWPLWVCRCVDEAGTPLASLGGIDFGRDGTPWGGDAYRRVVEAELALEALSAKEIKQ